MENFLFLIGSLAGAAFLAWSTNWLALNPWRRSRGMHWAEQARILLPARRAARLNLWSLPGICILGALSFSRGDACWVFAGIGGLVGAHFGTLPMTREIFPRIPAADLLRDTAVACARVLCGWFVLLSMIWLMPPRFNALGLGIALCYLAFRVAWGRWLGFQFWQRFGLILPAPERLRRMTEETAAKMNVPYHGVFVLNSQIAQAAADISGRRILFTRRIVDLLPEDELSAVCAHELAHLTEARWVRYSRYVVAFSTFMVVFLKPVLTEFGPLGVVGLFLMIIAVPLLFRRASRRLESRADRMAVASADAAAYARALTQLHEDNLIPAVYKGTTHPSLYDRVLAAGVTPDYPRPKASGRMAWNGMLFYVIGLVILILVVTDAIDEKPTPRRRPRPQPGGGTFRQDHGHSPLDQSGTN